MGLAPFGSGQQETRRLAHAASINEFAPLLPIVVVHLIRVNFEALWKVNEALLVSEALNCCLHLFLGRICTNKDISFIKPFPPELKQMDHIAHTIPR